MTGTTGARTRSTRGFLECHKVTGGVLTLVLLLAVGVGSGELVGSVLARLAQAALGGLTGGS